SSNGNICSGNSAVLTASGASSYTWLPGSSTSSSFTVSPLTSTIYTVTGLNTISCSSSSSFSQVVTPTPTLIVSFSPQIICANHSASLFASGASSFTWLPVNTTGSMISVSIPASTVFSVTGANGNCINSTTLSVPVASNPVISISSPTAFCPGKTYTLYPS